MGNCLTSAQPRATVQDLACSSELAKPRVAAVLDLSQPRERPVCLDLGGGKFSRVGSGAFSSGLSFHPGGFSLVSGFRALLPGQSSCAAARVVRSVSPLLGPLRVPTGSVGVVGCVPGPVAPHVVPAVVSAGPLGIPARYASAMAEIEETISHAWDPATVKRREKLMLDLARWLDESGLGCGLADCSPNHLLMFFKLHWLLAHRGTRLHDGRMVAAWSSLSCAVSHVSTGLRQRGRVLDWDEVSCPLGNPAVNFRMRKWVSGYSEELWRAGYREGSAVPLSPAKLVSLLSYLDSQSTRTGISGLDMLASLRDALCYLYCWGSAMRGKEAGKLELSDLYRDRDGKVPVDFPLPLVLPADTLLVVCCHGSKTVRRQICDPVLKRGSPHPGLCGPLTFYLHACTQCNVIASLPKMYMIYTSCNVIRCQRHRMA